MSLQEQKELLHKTIDIIDDEKTLKLIQEILSYATTHRTPELKQFTKEELRKRILQSEEDIKNGDVYTAEEVLIRLKKRINASKIYQASTR